MNVFLPADILIPDVESMEKWSVIACDQFSSQPEYWKDVKETVGDAPVELPHVLLLCDDRSDVMKIIKKHIPIQKMQMLRQDMRWWSWKIFTTKRWNFLRFIELLQRQMKKHYWMSFKKHVAPRMDIQYNGIRKSAKVFFI